MVETTLALFFHLQYENRTIASHRITTYIPKPLTSNSKADGRFGKQDFVYLRQKKLPPAPGRLSWLKFSSTRWWLKPRRP